MPLTPQQNPGCNVGIVTAVIVLVAVGGVVSFLVSGGDEEFLPGFIIPLVLIFVVVPIIGRAVKNARRAAQGGGSSTASRPAASTPSAPSAHRPYRYDPATGERNAAPEPVELPRMMDEQEHRRKVSEIMARRKREMKTGAGSDETAVEAETADYVEPTEEEASAQRQQNRDQTKRKLSDIAESIRRRNRELESGPTGEPPPGYTLCVNCGNLTRLTGKKTRCSTCGSIIEAE
jgi:rubrerythrin